MAGMRRKRKQTGIHNRSGPGIGKPLVVSRFPIRAATLKVRKVVTGAKNLVGSTLSMLSTLD
jgi:hypothetical protein